MPVAYFFLAIAWGKFGLDGGGFGLSIDL